MTFLWAPMDRQIRFEGTVEKLPEADSAYYFGQRPKGSQLAAAASEQSAPLSSRQELLDRYQALSDKVGDGPVPCPADWGGYLLRPHHIEFWQGMPSRLHDRVVLSKSSDETAWTAQRLMP